MASGRFTEIPIVDLAHLDGGDGNAALVDEIREICHEVGFFVVVNHGVEPDLVQAVFDSMRTFFALPEPDKRLIDKRASRHFRGWEPVGAESTNNRPDIREQIDLWSEWPAREPTRNRRISDSSAPTSGCRTTCCPDTGNSSCGGSWNSERSPTGCSRSCRAGSGSPRTTSPSTSAISRCRSRNSSRIRRHHLVARV